MFKNPKCYNYITKGFSNFAHLGTRNIASVDKKNAIFEGYLSGRQQDTSLEVQSSTCDPCLEL